MSDSSRTTCPSDNEQCQVCGASALYVNYGARTCYSCKIFFRRNASREKKNFRCHFDNNCQINIWNRHTCTFCRMKKCLSMGMQVEFFRSRRSAKKSINISQMNTTDSQLSEDLLQLIECFNERKLLSIIQQWTNQSLMNINEIELKEFFEEIYRTTGEYLRVNQEFLSLSLDDRSAFLRNIIENLTCFSRALIWHFSQLNQCEHVSYLTADICKFMDEDIILAKLALSLFAFSLHTSIFSPALTMASFNTLAIVRIQHNYVEILWKYLLQKYDHSRSILRFLRIIQCLLASTMAVYHAQNITQHVNDIHQVVERIELLFVVNDIESLQ